MHHLMLDVKTLDIKPSAVVLMVAAVVSDPKAGELGAEFEPQWTARKLNPAEASA